MSNTWNNILNTWRSSWTKILRFFLFHWPASHILNCKKCILCELALTQSNVLKNLKATMLHFSGKYEWLWICTSSWNSKKYFDIIMNSNLPCSVLYGLTPSVQCEKKVLRVNGCNTVVFLYLYWFSFFSSAWFAIKARYSSYWSVL